MIEPENGSWSPLPNTAPTVIDLPSTAIHDVKTPPQRVFPPEPLALVAPVIDISAVEPVVDPLEPEPVPAPDPKRRRRLAARFEERWRLWQASRATEEETPDAFLADAEAAAPLFTPDAAPVLTPVVEIAAVEAVVDLLLPPAPAEVEPVEAIAPAPEPAPVAEPEVEPTRPAEPAEVAPAARVDETVEHSSRGAAEWQPSTSLWANRVFNARSQPVEVASWPPTRKTAPPADLPELPDIDAEVCDSARVE
jgi:hypothetical protein